MSGRPVWVVGAGGHATSVAESVAAAGLDLLGFVDEHAPGRSLLGLPVVGAVPEGHVAAGGGLVVAVGDNAARQGLRERLAHPDDAWPAVVHPSASVSRWAEVGPGAVGLQRAAVAAGARVGAFAVVNTGALLEHDGDLGPFASLAPGALTGGRVRVGARTAVGIGAVVRHGVRLGEDAVLGAAAYLDRDLPDRVVAYGTPARVVRTREPGEPYL